MWTIPPTGSAVGLRVNLGVDDAAFAGAAKIKVTMPTSNNAMNNLENFLLEALDLPNMNSPFGY